MKRKVVFAVAGICLVAMLSVLATSLAYSMQFDFTKLNHFIWNGSSQTEPTSAIDGAELRLSVKKQFSSEEPSDSRQFSFELNASSANAPMPGGSSGGSYGFTIKGAGEILLPEIVYSKPGVYSYTVRELDDAAAGYTYDTSVYTVTVTVEDGESLKITGTEISMSKNGKTYGDLSEVVFTNFYTPVDKTGELPKMSDNSQPGLYYTVLVISALGFIGCCLYLIFSRRKSRYEKKN